MDARLVHRRAGPRRAQANPPFFPVRARLMKRAFFCANSVRAAFAARSKTPRRALMSSKQKIVVRKPTKKIADSRPVRYGARSPPRVVRSLDKATQDTRAIRFGAGSAPAALRK